MFDINETVYVSNSAFDGWITIRDHNWGAYGVREYEGRVTEDVTIFFSDDDITDVL